MNFQIVQQTLGQNNEKGYQISTLMCAVLREIGAIKLDRKNNPYMSCKINDDNNITRNITIRAGSQGFPTPDLINKRCIFTMQPYSGQQGLAFSGFYNGLARQENVVKTAAAKAEDYSPATMAGNDSLIIRQVAVKCAAEMVGRMLEVGAISNQIAAFTNLANCAYNWLMQTPISIEPELSPEPEPPEPGADDIPF